MNAKLIPEISYLAGLTCKGRFGKNVVGIETRSDKLEKRFIEICINHTGVMPEKIRTDVGGYGKIVYTYNSRLSKELAKIADREVYIFKSRDARSAGYVAGLFDSFGRVAKGNLYIHNMSAADQIMLGNLDIHTRGERITGISSLMALIEGISIRTSSIRMPGNERDPHK